MDGALATFFGILLTIALALVLIVIFTLIFRWLWNTTMPEVFGLKTVTFWQALKILILASLLFGGPRAIERQVEVEEVRTGTAA
ncbi:MAG: hypothetical protein ACLFV8_09190 [Alphaproteobacteria bacterium]